MTPGFPADRREHDRCRHCGSDIPLDVKLEKAAEYGSDLELAIPFCSDSCAKQYRAQHPEDIEEFEEISRAGAT